MVVEEDPVDSRSREQTGTNIVISVRDPGLFAVANIARHRRLDAARSLETVFEKAIPILRRGKEPACLVYVAELPPDLRARVAAMPEPEQRIRAIVEFRLSAKTDSSQQDQTV